MLISKPSQEEILAQLTEKQLHRFDHTQLVNHISCVSHDENVRYQGDYFYSLSDSALGQMLNRFSIPIQFYKRCSNSLKRAIFNEFVQKCQTENLMFRMDPGKPLTQYHFGEQIPVRAVLTTGYSAMDDHELFPIVFDALEGEEVTYHVLRWDDQITQLSLTFPDAQVQHNDQTYTAGMIITNSETGHSSVWIEPVVHTNTCSFVNRSCLKTQGVESRIVHRGSIDADRVRNMVQNCKEVAQVGVVQLIEAWEQSVSTHYALTYAKSIDSLPKRMFDILQEEWEDEQEIIKAEAARRIILLAQELPLFQRVTVEQQAGKMLGLFKNYQARIQDIINEIE